ncbi:hypothetical protein A2U01_0096430, partial [Trifolium medium]|nr:hypothetical protein [Trifolium medium]
SDDAEDAPASDVQNDVPEVIKKAESNTEVSSSEQTYAPKKRAIHQSSEESSYRTGY